MPILGNTAGQAGRTPEAATITGVTAGNGQVSVAFNEPAYKGKGSITYTATSSPGGFNATGTSPITVTGLSNGTSYTFTVTALSSSGVSTASSASSSATPVNPTFVYWTRSPSGDSTLDKFNTNTETTASGPTTTQSRYQSASTSNTPTAGYFATGTPTGGTAAALNSVDKLAFATDSSSVAISSGAFTRLQVTGFSNVGTAGYYTGGEYFSSFSNTGKITYSNDTFSDISKNISITNGRSAMMSNKGSAAYLGHGSANSAIQKFTFSNETYSTIGNSGYASYHPAGLSNSGTAGYMVGGTPSQFGQNVRKISFSNDTISSSSGSVYSRYTHSGSGIKGSSGFMAGGSANVNGQSVIEKITFSTDTWSELGARIAGSGDRQFTTSVANEGAI
jgi:hypothetical protein